MQWELSVNKQTFLGTRKSTGMWLLEKTSISGINARKVSPQQKRDPVMVGLHTCDPQHSGDRGSVV